MLLRFGVSNHLSIRDEQELLFTVSSLHDRKDGLIDCAGAPRGSIVPAVVTYGANASGKSNLIHAMGTMQRLVLTSQTQGAPGGGVPHFAFKLDDASIEKPSQYDIDFILDGVRYHYGFESTDTQFEAEWLYAFPKSHRRVLFERQRDNYRFGRELRGRNSVIAELTRPNTLFVSAAAQHNHEQLSGVFSYFRSLQSFMSISVPSEQAATVFAQDGLDPRVLSFLERIGTGVYDYRLKETALPEEMANLQQEVLDLIKRRTTTPIEFETTNMLYTIELAHRSRSGKPVYLELGMESAGTLRLLMVLSLVYHALDHGVPVVIDELDASLHTLASEAILQLFCSRETNPKGAQLIATTHDTNLLASPALRRDQVWFTEKDPNGATVIFPLTEIRTRSGDNFQRGYLQGRYGAIPFSGPVPTLGTQH
ncbi:MAG: ATP-binding protein [Spirochaetaceae bacterium]|nr:ATP-binding protein [Spirochaetaceae bacterium]